MYIYFVLWAIVPFYDIHSVALVVPHLAIGTLSGSILCVSEVPGTCYMFPASVLATAITLKNPVSFIAERYFQSKIQAPGVLIATRCQYLQNFLADSHNLFCA